MRNCDNNPANIRSALDNITEHYQDRHRQCHFTSRCRQPGYVPSRLLLTDPVAVNLLRETLQKLYVYKNPEKYTNCMSNNYLESFNNVALIYVDKRVHYKVRMYEARLGLCILYWNENVDRPVTSIRRETIIGRPLQR